MFYQQASYDDLTHLAVHQANVKHLWRDLLTISNNFHNLYEFITIPLALKWGEIKSLGVCVCVNAIKDRSNRYFYALARWTSQLAC